MANECMNYITIKGDNDLLQLFADSYLKKKDDGNYSLDFNIIAPIPKDCENDYEFRINNWGNKWDGTHGYVTFYQDDKYIGNEIFIDVSTAWSPCEPITYKLISLCPGLYFHHEYYEGGDGFVGWIEHHPDERPDEYEEVNYTYNDGIDYWWTVFNKEFESYDWLSDYINECLDDETITKEEHEELRSILDAPIFGNDEEYLLIEMCCEKGVLN